VTRCRAAQIGGVAALLVMLGLWAREGVTLRIEMTLGISEASNGEVSWSGDRDG
jgi:hypothetical protein